MKSRRHSGKNYGLPGKSYGLSGKNYTLAATAIALALSACVHSQRQPASIEEAERARVGSPFLDDVAVCSEFSDKVSHDQAKVIGDVMATHAHRLNHVLWHATRNSWSSFSTAEKKVLQKLSPQWGKNAPVCPAPTPAGTANAAGEEFLLMHHQMVDSLRAALVESRLQCIAGWQTLPEKDDSVWPVPAGERGDSSKSDKTGTLMSAWMSRFDDSRYLKGKSLSYIGYLVELSIHNHMHMRWAARPSVGDDFSPLDNSFNADSLVEPSNKYDDPKYHWLGNPYSAHVNPIFWKLHGWVDAVIPKWLKANGYSSISANCGGKSGCYQWKTKWVGGMVEHAAPGGARGLPHSHPQTPKLDPSENETANRAIRKAFSGSGFGNAKFDRFQNPPLPHGPVSHAPGAPPRDAAGPDPLEDPAVYVKQFGPCSGG